MNEFDKTALRYGIMIVLGILIIIGYTNGSKMGQIIAGLYGLTLTIGCLVHCWKILIKEVK